MRSPLRIVVLSFILGSGSAATVSAQNAADRGTRIRGVTPTDGTTNLTRTEAPDIIFATSQALLILIDGDPVYRGVEGTALQRMVNTKPLILRDETGSHYLRILDGWMETYVLRDWWSVAGVPPQGADIALREAVAAKSVDLLDGSGPPRFAAVEGTSLEYLENTTAKVFREPTDQELYVLVSGRWFRSWTTEGPWQFIPSDQLPADFAKIPESQLKSNLRRSSGE